MKKIELCLLACLFLIPYKLGKIDISYAQEVQEAEEPGAQLYVPGRMLGEGDNFVNTDTSQEHNTILIINPKTQAVVRRLGPIEGYLSSDIVVSEERGELYAIRFPDDSSQGTPGRAGYSDARLVAISTETGEILRVADTGPHQEQQTQLVLSPDSRRLYMHNSIDSLTKATVVDLDEFETVGTFFPGVENTLINGRLGIDARGKQIYLARGSELKVADAETLELLPGDTYLAEPEPNGSFFGPLVSAIFSDPMSRTVYAFDGSRKTLNVFDTGTATFDGQLRLYEQQPDLVAGSFISTSSAAIDPCGRFVYIGTRESPHGGLGISIIDTRRTEELLRLTLEPYPVAPAFYRVGRVNDPRIIANPNGEEVYIFVDYEFVRMVSGLDPEEYPAIVRVKREYVLDVQAESLTAAPFKIKQVFPHEHSMRRAVLATQTEAKCDFSLYQRATALDYDGDYVSDFSIHRLVGGGRASFYLKQSSLGVGVISFAESLDSSSIPVEGDFDGDGKSDPAQVSVSPEGYITWGIKSSKKNELIYQWWGLREDIAVPADYDGDGLVDRAVFRNGQWYILHSVDGSVRVVAWGMAGDIPVPGFYDKDNIADIAIWRPWSGVWWIIHSSAAEDESVPDVQGKQWGLPGDLTVLADYDGDGRDDTAVWRPATGTWYLWHSSNDEKVAKQWGLPEDVPVAGVDFNGDGKWDPTIWRESGGNWFSVVGEHAGVGQWGLSGDLVPSSSR